MIETTTIHVLKKEKDFPLGGKVFYPLTLVGLAGMLEELMMGGVPKDTQLVGIVDVYGEKQEGPLVALKVSVTPTVEETS